MSILNRFAVTAHLDDSAFAEIWSAAAAGGHSASHPHLAACAQCRARFAEFREWLEGLRTDAQAEAEEAFPSERLVAQQSAILRRLEAMERPARVIAFPKHTRPVATSHRMTHRWVATAAAAGLVIGLAAGQLLDLKNALDRSGAPESTQVSAGNTTPARPAPIQPASLAGDEALFYGEAEISARSARYLPAIDELVPRARDEFDRIR